MRIIAKLLLLSLEEDEEVVLNAVMSALGSFENKTQLKEEIACEKLAFAGMEIDASKRLVYRGEKEVNITFTEFEILHLLARNPGRVFSKEQIYDIVWKESYSGDYNIIMSHIRNIREKIEDKSFSDYTSKYNSNVDFSALFSGTSDSSSVGNTNMLSDYAAIKNGSYGKLMKAYYAKQDAEKLSGKGDTSQKLTLMKTSADSLKKSADALNDSSLWEKKKIKKKDEKTGEEIEVEDYDWDKITKAVKSFVEDYNDVVKEAGESNTKDVLRNASWMTGMTDKNSNMLAKIGITIGKGNKLELDEDALKQADISSLKTVFTGYNSFVSKISQKATGISNAANRASATYTNNGTYSKTDSSLTSSKIDKEV